MSAADGTRGARVAGRVVVVVGASSGIGRATAHRLAARGDRLVLAARSAPDLAEAAAECTARGAGAVLVVPTDVTDERAVRDLVDRAVERFGRIDGWVQAAGVIAYAPLTALPAERFRQVVATVLFGTLYAAQAVLPVMRAQGSGTLVVFGSLLGRIAAPGMGAYVSAKWAVHGLVRALQIEQRDVPGVRVVHVSPGAVNTPIYEQAANLTGRATRPPPPVIQPERVAARVVQCLDRPRRQVSVGPANGVFSAGFRLLPGVYDAIVGPLMGLAAYRRERWPATDGNLVAPQPGGHAVSGRWARSGLPGLLGWARR